MTVSFNAIKHNKTLEGFLDLEADQEEEE